MYVITVHTCFSIFLLLLLLCIFCMYIYFCYLSIFSFNTDKQRQGYNNVLIYIKETLHMKLCINRMNRVTGMCFEHEYAITFNST